MYYKIFYFQYTFILTHCFFFNIVEKNEPLERTRSSRTLKPTVLKAQQVIVKRKRSTSVKKSKAKQKATNVAKKKTKGKLNLLK